MRVCVHAFVRACMRLCVRAFHSHILDSCSSSQVDVDEIAPVHTPLIILNATDTDAGKNAGERARERAKERESESSRDRESERERERARE